MLWQPPELPASSPWGSSLPPFSSRPPGLSSMWEGPSFYPKILSLPSLFSLLKMSQGPGLMTCVLNSGQQTPLSSHQELQVCVSHCNSYKEQSPVNSKNLGYFQSATVITGQDRPQVSGAKNRAQDTKMGHSPSSYHPRCFLSPGCPASPTLNLSLPHLPKSRLSIWHFLYLGVVTENPKSTLIPGKAESTNQPTNTPSLNPKIHLTGQILAGSRMGESRRPKGSLSSNGLSCPLLLKLSPHPGLKGYKSNPSTCQPTLKAAQGSA